MLDSEETSMRVRTRFVAVAGVWCLAFSSSLAAQESGGAMTPAERQELAGYRLTMDNIKKAAAAGAKLNALEKDPKVKAVMESQEATSLADAIQKLNGLPEARAAVEGSGLTAKDFMLTIIQLGYTAGAVKLQAMGGEAAEAVAKLPTSPQNMEFYAAHKAEIEPLEADLRSSNSDDEE
jgi:hypothetical protein